ncbi:uncharacterized protein LOC135485692 [Lineus longissimus]|uniref:uncharacterized protein LOC135485692 n=1 Tax=Lineus longissimus TaxID=88925 RepID=UPI00315D644F
MYVISTAIPPPPTLPIKCETCRKIQMSFYGPGGIPLVVPHVSFGDADLSTLINMADYGAKAGNPIMLENNSTPDVVWPDYQISVTPEGTLSDAAADSSSLDTGLQKRKYVIQLIFILEKVNDHFTTGKYLNFLDSIRQNLQHLVTIRNKKIRRPVHTSLDKVLMNKKTLEEEILRNKILKKAIPTISNALCSVLTQSVNKNFREECFNSMKVTNSRAMKRVLHKNLWSIASKVHGVVPCEETILPFEERVSQPQQPVEEAGSRKSEVPRKRRKQQYVYDCGDDPCPSRNSTQTTCTEDFPGASTMTQGTTNTLATIQPSANLHAPVINFDALGTAFIRDEDSIFQDDMGGIEDIEMAEQILLEEVRKITEEATPAAEKLEASIDDSWFNDLIDDPEFLI